MLKERTAKIEQGIVPVDYKKTRVGIIPEDWEVMKLGDISYFRQGFQIKSADQIKSPEKGYKRYLYINDFLSNENKIYVKNKATYYLINSDDICIANTGSAGESFRGAKGILSNNMFKIFNQEESIIKDYLWHFLKGDYYWGQVHKLFNTGGQPHVGHKNMSLIEIKLPPVQEQKLIVNVLSTWDKMLGKIENLIKEKETQKKGLVQQLLTGENRLTGFKEEWKEVNLREIADRITEKNNSKSKNVLTISAIDGLVNQEKYFSKQIASRNLDNYTYLEKGDFAYNKSYSKGFPLGTIKMLEMYEAGVVSSLYICFRANESVHKSYLKQYFDANMFNHEIYKVAQEGARNHGLLNIGLKDFFDIKLNIPPLNEQKAITDILSTADKEIELLRELLENKKEEKKGLMQLLLTGIIRI